MNADRTLLTDKMWAELAPRLPGQLGHKGVTAQDTRRFVEAVLWVGRTWAPWRDLPPHLGHWHRVYVRFARWHKQGVWRALHPWLTKHKLVVPPTRRSQRQPGDGSQRRYFPLPAEESFPADASPCSAG